MAAITLVGFFIGIGSWVTGKILNDIYAETLGKKVRACIKRIVRSSPSGKKKAVALVIGNYKSGAIIVIAATGINEEELFQAESNIPNAVVAIASLHEKERRDSTVYLYELVGSQLNLTPGEYNSVQEAIENISKD